MNVIKQQRKKIELFKMERVVKERQMINAISRLSFPKRLFNTIQKKSEEDEADV